MCVVFVRHRKFGAIGGYFCFFYSSRALARAFFIPFLLFKLAVVE
jgi:hypothetical protein